MTTAAAKDGSSNTLLLVESHSANIVWSEPRDLNLTAPATPSLSSGHPDHFTAAFADCTTRALSNKIDPQVLRQHAHRRDGKPAKGWDDE